MRQPRILDRLAADRRLDALGDALRVGVHNVLRPGMVKDLLHGVFLGHPLHPALVQLPIGCFLSATDSQADHRRIGVVHAAVNSTALLCYVTSLWQRRGGRRVAGVLSALAGLACAGAGATLGGDLAYRRGVGASHAEQAGRLGPADWCDLGAVADFPADTPVRRQAGEIPVLVVRRDDEFRVLSERCSHMSGPLSEGTLGTAAFSGSTTAGQCTVRRPRRNSAWTAGSGTVVWRSYCRSR